MIGTMLGFYVAFVLNVNNIPACQEYIRQEGTLDGCMNSDLAYMRNGKEVIYVGDNAVRPRDFVLYHEIGHQLFQLNYDNRLFSNKEIMADQFALFVWEHKYPKTLGIERQDRFDYFSRYCDEQCVKKILSIKVPNLVPWVKSFNVFQ